MAGAVIILGFEIMENKSFFTTRLAVKTLLTSWLLASGLFLLSYHTVVGAAVFYAFVIGHGFLVAVMRERITRQHMVGMLSRDCLIVMSAPWLGPLVWYYRWGHNMASLEKSSGRSLRFLTALVLLLAIIPLLVWVLKNLARGQS